MIKEATYCSTLHSYDYNECIDFGVCVCVCVCVAKWVVTNVAITHVASIPPYVGH